MVTCAGVLPVQYIKLAVMCWTWVHEERVQATDLVKIIMFVLLVGHYSTYHTTV